jgi:hypothetical protein
MNRDFFRLGNILYEILTLPQLLNMHNWDVIKVSVIGNADNIEPVVDENSPKDFVSGNLDVDILSKRMLEIAHF